MARNKERLTKEAALSFLLTHIIVEKGRTLTLDQLALFNLLNLAGRAVALLSEEDGTIPHEVIEQLAMEFLNE